jgi:hypothetical protein
LGVTIVTTAVLCYSLVVLIVVTFTQK